MKKYAAMIWLLLASFTFVYANPYIAVSPREATVEPGGQVPFTVGLIKDGKPQQVLPWEFSFTAKQGNFSGNVYRAPEQPGTYIVLVQYQKLSTLAMVTVKGEQEVASIELSPSQIEAQPGEEITFQAKVYGKSGKKIAFSPAWGAKGGKIDSQGNFTAGEQPGTYKVLAWGPGGIQSSAEVTIRAPAQLTQIKISPSQAEIHPGESVTFSATGYDQKEQPFASNWQWQASGGSISKQGKFSAQETGNYTVKVTDKAGKVTAQAKVTVVPAPAVLTKLTIAPEQVQAHPGEKITFSAQAYDQRGDKFPAKITWQTEAGTINDKGVLQIAEKTGEFVVTAQASVENTQLQSQAIVTVTPEPSRLQKIVIELPQQEIYPGSEHQFSYRCYDQKQQQIQRELVWSSNGGQVDNQGNFVAGETTGEFWVQARHPQSGVEERAFFSIVAPPQPVTKVEIFPKEKVLHPGESQRFEARVFKKEQLVAPENLRWQATGGKINSQGEFVAGEQTGEYQVVVSEASSGLKATAQVVIEPQPPVATKLAISPGKIKVNPQEKFQFQVKVWDEQGQEIATSAVKWRTNGGTIDEQGLFEAGKKTGRFLVLAFVNRQVYDKAVVRIKQEPQLTYLKVKPQKATLQEGESLELRAYGFDQNKQRLDTKVKWSCEQGTVDASGKYTAPDQPGVFEVKAEHPKTGKSATAKISVRGKELYRLVVTPQKIEVRPGEKVKFQAQLYRGENEVWTWPWDITYIPDKGEMRDSVYHAPRKPGVYRITVRHAKASSEAIVIIRGKEVAPEEKFTITQIKTPSEVIELETGEKVALKAQAIDQNGKPRNVRLIWEGKGGRLDKQGVFTAGDKPGEYKVVVREPVTGVQSSFQLRVTKPAPDYRIVFEPDPLVVAPKEKKPITFKLYKGDFEVWTWPWDYSIEATKGHMSHNTYIAPERPGTYQITIKHEKAQKNVKVVVRQPELAKVQITPEQVSLKQGEQLQFAAKGFDKQGKEVHSDFNWQCSGGTITQEGLFTAGSEAGKYRVRASSPNSSAMMEAKVKIEQASDFQIAISPENPTLGTGESKRFTLRVKKGAERVLVWPWELKCQAKRGSFDGTKYTAPQSEGQDEITIRYDNRIVRTTVTVKKKSLQVAKLKVIPEKVEMHPLQKQEFQVKAFNSDGEEVEVSVNWQAQGGYISSRGLFVAKDKIGEFQVTAVEKKSGVKGQATVDIQRPFTKIVVEPEKVVLRAGETQDFRALAKNSEGKLVEVPVEWSTNAGVIDSDGVLRASLTTGKDFFVRARHQESGSQGFAVVGISDFEAIQFRVTPEEAELTAGEELQFKVAAYDAHRNRIPVQLKWFATGGEITQNGLYRAGNNTGYYQVTAIEKASNLYIKIPVIITQGSEDSQEQDDQQVQPGYVLKVAPKERQVRVGQEVSLSPSLLRDGHTVYTWPWEFRYTASGGMMKGKYRNTWQAPRTPGIYTVKVFHEYAHTSLKFTVVEDNVSQVERLVIYPEKVILSSGTEEKFQAKAYDAYGNPLSVQPKWQATGGKIDRNGLFKAGEEPGRFKVTALVGGVEASADVAIPRQASTRRLGRQWALSLKNGIVTNSQVKQYISEKIFKKSDSELQEFRRGFVDIYGPAGYYLVKEFLCHVATDFGKQYGHDLYWGDVDRDEVAYFIRSYILRLPKGCHHTFKRGFLSGYSDYEGSFIFDRIWRRVFERR